MRMDRTRKLFRSSKNHPAIIASFCSLALIAALLITRGKPDSPSDLVTLDSNSDVLFTPKPAAFQSKPSFVHMNETEVIWQVAASPKAVLFLAHGCGRRPGDFWDRSAGCPQCTGMPEERVLVRQALERNFSVLAVASWGACWSSEKEMESVKGIIAWWVSKNHHGGLPLVALGASSGGYFVSGLAAKMKFSSIVIMIAEGVFESMDVLQDYPPTLFVHMPKDRIRMSMIKTNMGDFFEKGVDVREVASMEFPLNPQFLADRIPGLSLGNAIKLLEIFRQEGFVDNKGYMKHDGRSTPWKEAVKKYKIWLEVKERADHINEELNLAFGYHEFSSLQSNDIFQWFESHMR